MGMFDYIKCEVMLPDATMQGDRNFQTNSLDKSMSTYVITQKGELYEECWDYQWVEDEGYLFFKGYLKQIEGSYHRKYLTDFHGDVVFYSESFAPDVDKSGKKMYRDYHARFTEGKLSRMWYEDSSF